jgi:DeoR family transcriptional regulator of aga operon
MAGASFPRLLVEERRRRILEILEKQERVTVAELSERFGVSAVTARADLDRLAEHGQLIRSHGGGLMRVTPQLDLPIKVKASLHHEQKVRIGAAAADLVQDGDTVILDSGTTTMEVARALRRRAFASLTIITNAITVAMELAEQPHVRMVVLGGIARPPSLSLVGPHAEQLLAEVRADRLFLGVDGFDTDAGMTTPDILEAQLNALMIKVSRETTVVADATKFARRSLSRIAGIEAVDRIITDDRIDPGMVATLRARDLEVIVV